MQKLDASQIKFIDQEIERIEERIKQLSSMIEGDDIPKLKKDFITDNINQLNIVKNQLLNMKKQ